MIRRSFLGWLFGGIGAFVVPKQFRREVTNFKSDGIAEFAPTGEAAVKAERITVRCKSLEVVSEDGTGMRTTVLIDGNPVAAKSITLSCDVKGIWHVGITYMPCIGLYGEKLCRS